MKAIILAAGIGSRLRPLTKNCPKTLIKVKGKPILGYLLDALLIRNVIIVIGYQYQKIINYCFQFGYL